MKIARLTLIILLLCTILAGCAGGGKSTNTVTEADKPGSAASQTDPNDSLPGRDYVFSEMEGLYKFQGRTVINERGIAMLSGADVIEFNADCSGSVTVKMLAEKTPSSKIDVYFTGYVDGQRCESRFHIGDKGEFEFTLATDLPKGDHTFRIVRQTEWNHGDIYFTGAVIHGKLIAPPENSKLLIEFIGDSLTTGFGNLSDIPDSEANWAGAPVFQDATQAYPYMIGCSLDADISVVAIQGIGCACGGQPFTINDIYNVYPRVYEKDYEFKPTRQADVVVINLLANDVETYMDKGVNVSEIVEKSVELVKTVRKTYPQAKIIFAPAAFYTLINAELEKLGGEQAGYYITSIPMDYRGKGGHPSVNGHTMAMNSLISDLTKLGITSN